MALDIPKFPVVLVEGGPRGGKGTVVKHFGETRQGVATDETGADYRAITKGLIVEKKIEAGMPPEVIARRLANVSLAHLVELAAGRQHIIDAYGFDSLYAQDVASTVGDVAPHAPVRTAVKDGFKERIRQVRDDDEHSMLVVDGRNLKSVIGAVEGAELFMRAFVTVHPAEAALRECMRLGIDPHSADGRKILENTISRGEKDSTRTNDPVRADKDGLHFSHDPHLRQRALHRLADHMFEGDVDEAREALRDTLDFPPIAHIHPRELGRVATLTDRQIVIDTTAFRGYEGIRDPRMMMLGAFDYMLDDALEASGHKA